MLRSVLAVGLALFVVFSVEANSRPSLDEMWELIQKQQVEIDSLKKGLSENDAKTEFAFIAVEEVTSGPAAKLAEWASKTSIGGYGELHYNNHSSDNSTSSKNEFDLHRFVLFAGHQYNDKLRFFSEFEIEHSVAGEGKSGEIEIEQAYVEYDYTDNHRAKAGVFLIPVGILNETHEPETFYGAERNPVEQNIIPSTWWEGGAMLSGEITEGLSYDAGAHSGLYISPSGGKYKIRDGRQKVSQAKGDDLAYTARLKYTGVPGLELATTVQYQGDIWQGEKLSGKEGISATLVEAHAAYKNGPFGFRALYAHWNLDSDIEVIQAGADEQEGWYAEPSYQITDKLGIFARFNQYDNTAGGNQKSERNQADLGFNYWIHKQVVLKVDYFDQHNDSGAEYKGYNVGVGWSF